MSSRREQRPATSSSGATKRVRVDVLLAEQGLFPSREAARRAVMAGIVSIQGVPVDKAGTFVTPGTVFDVARPAHDFVSRGGLKLERALSRFDVLLDERVVLDVGASTGGFTDCALRHGAARVYAVDVGYGQLDWRLRNDERVVVMERTNFRHVDPDSFHPSPNVGVMDVSFISTRLLLPNLRASLSGDFDIISLIKPQFEAGREHVGKGGIVRDPLVHLHVLLGLMSFLPQVGLTCRGLDYSPVTGGDGNLEFLGWWKKDDGASHMSECESDAFRVVTEAWRELRNEDVSGVFLSPD
ncbi:TlyA family RNA methyltransferase [Alicyclobacillus sp. ALC3]|uniref:TlyA family RNA methyltransferase n=1 Tax=Alicyclobacillus sp. ALC3 TaxID=2796143 RepID=UPI0023790127|nr:TlyA family RNA methyltransferase [Alicyclobacillus sp. ALC3]WDL97036.1 TlyA family RNA methyltransferase [Alicyclobacillus sp. ALC3]